jgi:hypothetical protein
MPDLGRVEDTIVRLERLRDDLRVALDVASANQAGTVAQLAAQYRAVCDRLLELDSPLVVVAPVSKLDELRERRGRDDREGGVSAAASVHVAGKAGGKRGA